MLNIANPITTDDVAPATATACALMRGDIGVGSGVTRSMTMRGLGVGVGVNVAADIGFDVRVRVSIAVTLITRNQKAVAALVLATTASQALYELRTSGPDATYLNPNFILSSGYGTKSDDSGFSFNQKSQIENLFTPTQSSPAVCS